MSDLFSGIIGTNPYYGLGEQNQAASLSPDLGDPLIAQEKNFSKMLSELTRTSDKDQKTGSFGNTDLETLYLTQQSIIELRRLSAQVGRSRLIGKEIIYIDKKANTHKTGIVERLVVDQKTLPVLVLMNGDIVPVGDVAGLKK